MSDLEDDDIASVRTVKTDSDQISELKASVTNLFADILEELKKMNRNNTSTPNSPRSPRSCYHCGKVGHFAKECRSPRNGSPYRPKSVDQSPNKSLNS